MTSILKIILRNGVTLALDGWDQLDFSEFVAKMSNRKKVIILNEKIWFRKKDISSFYFEERNEEKGEVSG
jgi:hypothetical protein